MKKLGLRRKSLRGGLESIDILWGRERHLCRERIFTTGLTPYDLRRYGPCDLRMHGELLQNDPNPKVRGSLEMIEFVRLFIIWVGFSRS